MLSEKIENATNQADVLMRKSGATPLFWPHFMAELAACAEAVREIECNCTPINTSSPDNIAPFRPRLRVAPGDGAA